MTGQETLIYIDENDKKEAGINAKHFAKDDVKNRAYYNTLGAQLIKKFLASENVDATNTYNIHSIKKILEEFDIADLMLGNIHIDVRVIFNENFIFIPKSHFKYEILPDIYLVLLMSNDKKYVKFLGFFEPKLLNKNNQNEDYYFIEKEKLTPPANLKEYINNFTGNTDQALSESEIDNADMLIISMIDQDISEQEKKQLLKNLVKSAKLRDRFIEFENFENLSYRAEHSPDVSKPELSTFPSLDVAAAATADALEKLDFGGSVTNEQKIANENDIINGFNDLTRNIPDLTPENPDSETSQNAGTQEIDDLSDFMNLDEAQTANEPVQDTISSENVTDETPDASENLLEFGELEDLALDFDTLESDNITDNSNETAVSQSGIIEQQNTQDIVNFDEIMPVETNDAAAAKTETTNTADETVDFNDITPIATSDSTPAAQKQDIPQETLSFDEIPADNTKTDAQNTQEISDAPVQELEDFDNLSIPNANNISQGAADTELALGDDLVDINNELTSEPEMTLAEPLQELSFDDESLSLEEPLLDVSDTQADTPVSKSTAGANNTSDLGDFETMLLEDAQTHNLEDTNTKTSAEQSALPEISQEDMELDRMLASENITPEMTADTFELEALVSDDNTGNKVLNDTVPPAEPVQQTAPDLENAEDTITDLNLEAEEIEKSVSTDDIAGIGEISELNNNTDISTNDLISQIDDLLGTEESASGQPAQSQDSDTEDKLGMLFNTNANANAEDSENADFIDEDENSQYPGQKLQQQSFAPEKGKKAVLAAAAIVAVLAIAGGAGLFLKSKGSSDLLAQNPIESDTANLPTPAGEDNTNLMTNAPDSIPPATAPATAQQKPVEQAKQTKQPKQTKANQQAAAKQTSAQKPSGTPLPYITVRSVAWEVPDYLSYSDKVKKYLQTAGKSIRLTLSSDLLLTNEYAYSNQVKVELKLKNDGTIQDAQITKSSGSNQINDIVLRTVKDTLKVVKPAPGEIPTPDFKLGLIINL